MGESLNAEKLEVLAHQGNALVIANPGTGKTLLLAHKYAQLVKSGVAQSDILCLTFTQKARKEMEERIAKVLREEGIEPDFGGMNVYTFHSYALQELGKEETVSSNLLRYSIYRYFKENEVLNYGDEYLIEVIVPKMENLIRYLKSFGVMPSDIDVGKVKALLKEKEKVSKEEMDRFAEVFVDVYRHYEEAKQRRIDYADMLIEFCRMKGKRRFKYVLVDELQDVNKMEAEIALESGESFFAVGDRKQAIFGFQGGSITNFEKFKDAKVFVLSENFRSENAILEYAREYFGQKTMDEMHRKELEGLRNPKSKGGKKPVVHEAVDGDAEGAACDLLRRFKGKQVAVIARTNNQIMNLSNELQKRGIEHSSTHFSASKEAREQVISFLKGMLSNDIEDVKAAMFTPFFPLSIQEAFELAKEKGLTMEMVFEKSPEFRKMREEVRNVKDMDELFSKRIIPIAITYGKEYLLAAITMQNAFSEALSVVKGISLGEVVNYLKSADILADESEGEKEVVLTTVHKAKGMEFPIVIYLPQKKTESGNFQDEVVKAILKTKGIDVEEELGEEALRINFVAMTRAKEELHIIPDRAGEYLNEFCEKEPIEAEGTEWFDVTERMKRAYALFVSGNHEKAKELLKDKRKWVVEFIKRHFEGIERLSFSSLKEDPCEYLASNVLKIRVYSPAMEFGSRIHRIAQAMVEGKEAEVGEREKPYAENIQEILKKIKEGHSWEAKAEERVNVELGKLVGEGEGLIFDGVIDALFREGDSYLIVDWKTDKSTERGSEHRQQLEAYRRALSISRGIPLEKIRVAIAFIGLRGTVNLGKVGYELDETQPSKSAFETFSKKVKKTLEWRRNPEKFLEDLEKERCEHPACRALLGEYWKEKENK
ncbi:MAG: ATP-dependent DNA helicase [Candidatus Anstonellales archaeon]